ncbi:hypothetical protein VPHK567_0341 [Vibrio phage K567]|nr:hypothetical protein MYOV011v1_p0280 [Vibrio phage 6E35.1a]
MSRKSKNKKKQKQRDALENKPRDFVAKYMNEFNHATVETDRKKEEKRRTPRKMKHKGKAYGD